MSRIQVHGRGVTLYVTEVSPEIAQELTETGVSIERFEEICASEETHAAGIRDDMDVFVDGVRISRPPEAQSQETPIALEAGKHYLIVRETADGRWLDIETDEPFDPAKFSAKVSTYLLSDGESITITRVEYAGAQATGETEAIDEDATVIFPDGARAEVVIAGEEDEDRAADEDDEEFLVVTTSSVDAPTAPKAPAKRAKPRGNRRQKKRKRPPRRSRLARHRPPRRRPRRQRRLKRRRQKRAVPRRPRRRLRQKRPWRRRR